MPESKSRSSFSEHALGDGPISSPDQREALRWHRNVFRSRYAAQR